MEIRNILQLHIEHALRELGIESAPFVLEHPADMSHGDYACNVAMVLAKKIGENPRALAEKIASTLQELSIDEVESVTVAGPGFINVMLSKDFFAKAISDILQKNDTFGHLNILEGKRVLVEHSSPNLFKPFHIGHMMNNTIGESIVRLMHVSGATVQTMSFPSDISLGVAKAIFTLLEKQDISLDNIALLGSSYVEGVKRYDEDETIHARVKEIADNLYAHKESPELDIFRICKDLNIKYFESITGRLGSRFDSYIFESEAGSVGKGIIEKHTPAIFTKSDGAIVYIPEESKKNLNTAVFINSQGNPTYEAKDVGLLKLKFDVQHPPDISIFITDHDQIPHFQIVLDAAEKINPMWAERSVHVSHGRMSFKGQKMASRLGGVPLVTDMIQLVLSEVVERTKDRASIDPREDAEAIAIGALKFTVLRTKPGQNINFDPDTSLSFEGDSGPYLQYTHARIQSLLEKGQQLGMQPKYYTQEVSGLEKMLFRLPEVVEMAIRYYAPQHIATYLIEVAREFNSFYAASQIVDEANRELSEHRLALARATQIVIRNGLYLLAIHAPEKM